MSKAGIIALLGLLTAFLPFVGIPTSVKTTVAVVFGLLILALGFLVREERRWLLKSLKGEHQTDAYTENGTRGYGETIKKTE